MRFKTSDEKRLAWMEMGHIQSSLIDHMSLRLRSVTGWIAIVHDSFEPCYARNV